MRTIYIVHIITVQHGIRYLPWELFLLSMIQMHKASFIGIFITFTMLHFRRWYRERKYRLHNGYKTCEIYHGSYLGRTCKTFHGRKQFYNMHTFVRISCHYNLLSYIMRKNILCFVYIFSLSIESDIYTYRYDC